MAGLYSIVTLRAGTAVAERAGYDAVRLQAEEARSLQPWAGRLWCIEVRSWEDEERVSEQ